jgi:hypothetical protein
MNLTVHLDRTMSDQNVQEIKTWLTNGIPSNARRITIQLEGVFDADSSIIQCAVPIEVWACLGRDDAYTFVAMTRSGNRLLQVVQTGVLAPLSIKGSENVKLGSASK